MKKVIKPTVYLNTLPWYNPKSILAHLENPDEPILNIDKSIKFFKKCSKEIYYPLLDFILQNEIPVNLVITADFLDQSYEHYTANLKIIQKLIDAELAEIVPACHYGEDLSAFYNMEWWAKSLNSSVTTINKYLGIKVKSVFVYQIYRSLEIERVIFDSGIHNFLVRQKGSKLLPFKLYLSEFRRFNGEVVSWINEENDVICNFIPLPDSLFFQPNSLLFLPKIEEQIKKMAMEIGLASSISKLKKSTKSNTIKQNLRINENPSLALYNDLEKSVLRLWEYMSFLILSRMNYQSENDYLVDIYKTFSKVQNREFLFYLQKNNYSENFNLNFSSPYESFATMQTFVTKLEILIQPKY